MWYDRNTGLSRTPNRAYAAATGDWTSTDPIGFSGGSSDLYSYVGNNATDTTDPSGQFALMDLLGHPNGGWFNQLSNFSAGFADTITGGGTQWVRIALDYNDCSGSNLLGVRGGWLRGSGSEHRPDVRESAGVEFGLQLGPQGNQLCVAGQRFPVGGHAGDAGELLGDGHVIGEHGAAGIARSGFGLCGKPVGAWRAVGGYRSGYLCRCGAVRGWGLPWRGIAFGIGGCECVSFHAELLRGGYETADEARLGGDRVDRGRRRVWSRPEDNPEAMGEWKRVEELFVRTAVILEVRVGGQVIETTAEHPFYVREKGWLAAGFVEEGDRVHGKDGEWTTVEDVAETQRVATVYNMRVADFHTYFVGGEEWGFSVWAHNQSCGVGEDPQRSVVHDELTLNDHHVFEGEINRRGRAVGFHHREGGNDTPTARMTSLESARMLRAFIKAG